MIPKSGCRFSDKIMLKKDNQEIAYAAALYFRARGCRSGRPGALVHQGSEPREFRAR
jgi:hypothetical protein